jgi:hypothetical protein
LNGATCDYYGVCQCTSGYTGTNCEKCKNKMFFLCLVSGKCDVPCSNGGICIGANKCQCTEGYQGPFCMVETGGMENEVEDDESGTRRVLIGLIVALCCSIIGLGTMVTIALVLKRSRARVPVAGAAGLDELNSM